MSNPEIEQFWREMNRKLRMGGVWAIPDGYTVEGDTIEEKAAYAMQFGFRLEKLETPDTEEFRQHLAEKERWVRETYDGRCGYAGPLILTKIAHCISREHGLP